MYDKFEETPLINDSFFAEGLSFFQALRHQVGYIGFGVYFIYAQNSSLDFLLQPKILHPYMSGPSKTGPAHNANCGRTITPHLSCHRNAKILHYTDDPNSLCRGFRYCVQFCFP